MQILEKINPKKLIIGAFIVMIVFSLTTDLTVWLGAGLIIVALLMLYGLHLLKNKDFPNLRFLFLLILVFKVITLAIRVLERAL